MLHPIAAPKSRPLFAFFPALPLLPLLLGGAALREGPETLASVLFARDVRVSVRNEAALACPAGLRVRLTPTGSAHVARSVESPPVAPGQTWSASASRTFVYGGGVRIEAWCHGRWGGQSYVRVDERVYRLTPNAGVTVRPVSWTRRCAGLADVVEAEGVRVVNGEDGGDGRDFEGVRPCVELSYH